MSAALLLVILRFLCTAGAVLAHCCFFRFCVDLVSLPAHLLQRSQSPATCFDRHNAHLVFLSPNQIAEGTHALMDLGQNACAVLRDRISETNAYRLLGHHSVIVLQGRQPKFVVAKVHRRLDIKEDNFPEWAHRTAECLAGRPTNCSRADVLHELNPEMPSCHNIALTSLLERWTARNHQGPVIGLVLHPALGLLESEHFGASKNTWPFPRYYGGCGIFAVTEYIGCSLSDYTRFPMTVKLKIALQLLDTAVRLDTLGGPGMGLFYRDLDLGNLALATDGRVFVTDTDGISLLQQREMAPKGSNSNEYSWECHRGYMQNTFEALSGILSPDRPPDSKLSLLLGIDSFRDGLGLPPHPRPPPLTVWRELSSEERSQIVTQTVSAALEVLAAVNGCPPTNLLRWLLTCLAVVLWAVPTFKCRRWSLSWRTRAIFL